MATDAAVAVLREGGSACDAAIAAAAVLNVVEPTSTGIGGDVFAIVWSARDHRAFGLNGSGRSPARLSLEALRAMGQAAVPRDGPHSVSVPGAVDAWAALHGRFGKIPWKRLLAPAIAVAEDGFAVTPRIASGWAATARKWSGRFPNWWSVYAPGGKAPEAGERIRAPALGDTFRRLALGGPREFYEGETGRRLASYLAAQGSLLDAEDLAAHAAEWVVPIAVDYHGTTLLELPPNTQGLAALEMLSILRGYDLGSLAPDSSEYLHLLIEAKKLAFADRDRHVADPDFGPLPIDELLSEPYAAMQRARIRMDRAMSDSPEPGIASMLPPPPPSGDTVYLVTADADGNLCSFINSLYEGFGSGLVDPATGIALQNRGSLFSSDPSHPNALAPRKRPFHTIIPALALRAGKPWLAFGVMGGDMQPQGHVQVLLQQIHFGRDAQDAGAAPRFQHFQGRGTALEPALQLAAPTLESLGHTVLPSESVAFGGYQAIRVVDGGGYECGSDPRKDGRADGF